MVTSLNNTAGLADLCSKDQLELLDSIDRLRLQGINNYVSLPQIIVCGDQSSGKSSVLEAISGVSFPVKSNLCTRFPTELVLRRTAHISATVSIVPHESRSDSEQKALSGFREELNGFSGLPDVIESAKSAMGISTHGKAFSKDLLRVEITGPDRPHLTIVDLPGLIHAETRHQSASDVELIQEVVEGYMKEPRSIILAVVSAKNDFANQIVLKLARRADVNGNRTLGVITKPDTLVPGGDSEALYVSLARNQEVNFRLGWHVLRNTDSEKGARDLAHRDKMEAEFFTQGVWKELHQSSLGITKFRGRLSRVLLRQIASELPSLINEIEGKFFNCQAALKKLGDPRASEQEQRLYLFQITTKFQSLVKSSVDGTYNDVFFTDAKTELGYQQRFRAVVQNLNRDFAKELSTRGHYREIHDKNTPTPTGVAPITTNAFIEHIQEIMRRTRGRELPGTFNPMIVDDLFHEQSRPWGPIVEQHVNKVWKAAKHFLTLAVGHVADEGTSRGLQDEIFKPALKDILEGLNAKVVELLRPHDTGHPITYNHYFTETLQKVRSDRIKDEATRVICRVLKVGDLGQTTRLNDYYDLQQLVTLLVEHTEPDMERHAAREALDCLMAYYKVALKRLIDDVAVEVVELKLVSALGNILSPVSVFEMSSSLVSRIAGESEESRTQREELLKQLDVFMKGLQTCKRFVNLRSPGKSSSLHQDYAVDNRS
ncbi:P-loop containing nucleoside triphosphate hydrolase protein [Bombardia bombarda]|uniref:P-loop containing nucleoside triphosphate hydrolase protein n=1 Tax=Bombardia bombarda TaxID=252184 RepID=A0AA40C1V1_9PEZI|nr:P-loop containing nucleoside triphosphate hydrolase protein [Bombardia bombarda]